VNRHWEVYSGRKKSIMMRVPEFGVSAYYWTWNKKWLRDFVKNKLITNLEYLEGLLLLEEVRRKS